MSVPSVCLSGALGLGVWLSTPCKGRGLLLLMIRMLRGLRWSLKGPTMMDHRRWTGSACKCVHTHLSNMPSQYNQAWPSRAR